MSLKDFYSNRADNFTLALAILISLCELLEFYHENDYVYLDVKPDNIFCLTRLSGHPTGEISFFDFDTVQLIADLKGGKWSAPRGSIGYAPREQRNKAEVRNITAQSDIYSVGATLHWLVTGNKPNAEDDLLSNHATYEWKPKKDLELTFLEKSIIDSIFSNTLQDSYLERYKDMASLIAELNKLKDASKVKILSNNLTHDEEDSYIITRKKDCKRINKALEKTGKYTIWGTPGLGKSELAKDYARHTFGKAYDTIIFLVVDGSLSTAITSELQVKRGSILQGNELDDRLKLLEGTDERTLIILDNYTEVDPDNELEMECYNVLFRKGGHHLIVTQRAPSQEKQIKPLSKAKLIKLYFMNRGKDFYCKDEEEFLKSHFLEVIESHTLVLVLVARLLTNSDYTLRQLCDDLKGNLATLDDGPDSEAETTIDYRKREGTYAIHIARLIDLSSLSADAARLFSLLSMVPAKGVDRKLLSQLCTADDFNKAAFNNALSALVKLGLAQLSFIEGNKQEVVLHPLISDIAAGLLEEGEVVEGYLERLLDYLVERSLNNH